MVGTASRRRSWPGLSSCPGVALACAVVPEPAPRAGVACAGGAPRGRSDAVSDGDGVACGVFGARLVALAAVPVASLEATVPAGVAVLLVAERRPEPVQAASS